MKNQRFFKTITFVMIMVMAMSLLVACQSVDAPTVTPNSPTATTEPTETPSPTDKVEPTTAPTDTPKPTEPVPTEPVETPTASVEPTTTPTDAPDKETEEPTVPPTIAPTEPAPTEKPTNTPTPTEPAHEHKYTEKVVKPTCTEKGYTKYECACGDSYTGNETPMAKHSYIVEITTEAGCGTNGWKTRTCENCDYLYVEEIPKVEHDFGPYFPDKNATYTENGTETSTCLNCGETKTRAAGDENRLKFTFQNILPRTEYTTEKIEVLNLPKYGDVIGTIEKNTAVSITGWCQQIDWARIEFGNSVGYINREYLSVNLNNPTPTPTDKPTEEPTTPEPTDEPDNADEDKPYMWYLDGKLRESSVLVDPNTLEPIEAGKIYHDEVNQMVYMYRISSVHGDPLIDFLKYLDNAYDNWTPASKDLSNGMLGNEYIYTYISDMKKWTQDKVFYTYLPYILK